MPDENKVKIEKRESTVCKSFRVTPSEAKRIEEVAAQKAAEEAGRLTMREYVGRWRSRRRDAVIAGTIGDETVEREEVELRRIEAYLGEEAAK